VGVAVGWRVACQYSCVGLNTTALERSIFRNGEAICLARATSLAEGNSIEPLRRGYSA
jgi:hypothetical protein